MTTPRKSSKAHGASSFESINDDDDEEEMTPAKRKRTVKKEEGKENGEEQSAYLFKMEQGENGVIDLENDEYATTTTFSHTVSLNLTLTQIQHSIFES
jgi:hypothetical protein